MVWKGKRLKKIYLALSSLFAAGTVYAGNLAEGIVESEIIEPAASPSSSGWVLPLVILGVVVAVAVASDDGGS